MTEAIVSIVLEQLVSSAFQDVRQVLGVDKEVEKLTQSLQTIQAVVADAEERQVKETTVRLWLDKLKDTFYDIEDVLDAWNTLNLETVGNENTGIPVCFFHFKKFVSRLRISREIKEINANLSDIARMKDNFRFNTISFTEGIEKTESGHGTFLVDQSEIRVRDNEKQTLVRKLCENSERIRNPHIISLVGIGGIGKTSLARFAYSDNEVVQNFDTRIWVCVSDPFDVLKIAKLIVESLRGSAPNTVDYVSLLHMISQSIVGKKFFLVLDDVWTEDFAKWEPIFRCLKNGLHGSKILITTRKEIVARMVESNDIITVKELSEEECWNLFRHLAFVGRPKEEYENLEDIGRKIVGKCKGLPLAAKTIASLLQFKKSREEWQNILDSEMWKLEEFEKHVFSVLLLSYYDLPPRIRRCFSYCAIFPKNYHIEKEQLIKLWMAQGYLGLEKNKEMEKIGQMYFDNLVARSFFNKFKKDCDGSILYYKMHDTIHDFVQFLNKNDFLTVDVNDLVDPFKNSSQTKVRHLMLTIGASASLPVSICSVKKLRSLIIQYGVTNCLSVSNVLPKLFLQLTSLWALDLSGKIWYENLIIEIPKEIGNLIHLRYLNLSSLRIKKLPKTICALYNLQTLVLSWCTDLKGLPQGMGRLINLRHLINDGTSFSYLPKGIERLTCLQTLSEFVVCGSGDGGKACTLECLKNLKHIQGSLSIKQLGYVTDVGEAKNAQLENKTGLVFLLLNFEGRVDDDKKEEMMHEGVLEALQPPRNLERLEIRDYGAHTISPNWIISLSKLRMLSLHDCLNFEHLPPLGKLPSLESLSVWSMRSVKKVGSEFFGIESDYTPMKKVGSEIFGIESDYTPMKKVGSEIFGIESDYTPIIAFPKLISLKFVNMEEWEEWDLMLTVRREDYRITTIMPCLCSLSLVYCPKLKKLPDQILRKTTLKELNINWCPILKEHYSRGRREEWNMISHNRNIMINFEYVQRADR